MSEAINIPEVFKAICGLGIAMGLKNLNRLPACWEHQIDKRWFVALNAHAEEKKSSTGVDVPPFSIYIEFNGWPAGIVDAHGGTMAAGEVANEDALLKAIEAATARVLLT